MFRNKIFYKVTRALSKHKNIYCIGFSMGMCSSFIVTDKTDLIQNPLTNLFFGSLNGYCIAFSSVFVADMFPGRLRSIVPVSILGSTLYIALKKSYAS